MATPRFAWGIDIGNRALKAVKLVPTAEGLSVDDFDVVEHDTVLSASGDNRDSLIQTALATFVARHPGIEKGQVGVSVNGQRTFAKFIKLPPVEKSKVPEIVKFEAIQQIPFPLDDVEWSYHLFQDPESPDIEVGIFAMRKELVNGHIKYFTDANLNVQVVQMSPLSVYNAMYYDSRIKGTTMIVDLGAESTDLIIAEGEGVWLRSIPIGGNNFTEALTKSFKVDFDKAEELKRNATTSRYSRQIVQAMRPIFADLVSEIQRSMGFYGSTHKDSKISRVIALGNTFRLPGLERYLQQNLSLKVESLTSLGTTALEDPKLAALFNENLLSSAGAYGLALQVMGQGKIASSLLPEQIRRAKMWREKNKWFATAAALFVAGTATAYGSYYYANTQLDSPANLDYRTKITSLEGEAKTLNTDWDTVESSGGTDLQRIKNVQALAEDRGVWPQINTLLHDKLPQFAPGLPKAFGEGDPVALKKVPRKDRQQIVITAYTSKYTPDVTPAIPDAATLGTYADTAIDQIPTQGLAVDNGQAGAPAAGTTAPDATKRGYFVTLKCVTPNAAGPGMFYKYILDLKASPASPQRPWKVAEATILRQLSVKDDQPKMAAMVTAWQAAEKKKEAANVAPPGSPAGQAGMPGMPPPPGGMFEGAMGRGAGLGNPAFNGSNGVPDEAYQDPVLGEDVRSDTEAIIVLAIQMDPTPPAPATPAPGAPGAPTKSVAAVTP
jgi:type IV pilus assembly protein PilM